MTEQQLKHLAIEYAISCLKAECRILNFGYKVDLFSLVVEWDEEIAHVYITDGEEKIEIATIGFDDVATVIKYPLVYTEQPFKEMAKKHNLIETVDFKTEEGEVEVCQEKN